MNTGRERLRKDQVARGTRIILVTNPAKRISFFLAEQPTASAAVQCPPPGTTVVAGLAFFTEVCVNAVGTAMLLANSQAISIPFDANINFVIILPSGYL